MEIRAIEGETIAVPAGDGESVYLAIQNSHHFEVASGGLAMFDLPRLYWGNRRELEGEVWRNKKVSRLVVERKHGS